MFIEKTKSGGLVTPHSVSKIVRSQCDMLSVVNECDSISINSGAAGFAFFLSQASDYLGDPKLLNLAVRYLHRGCEVLETHDPSISFYRSISGFAWVIDLISSRVEIDGSSELLDDVDALLLEALRNAPSTMKVEVIDGAGGLLIYAMRRLTRGKGASLMAALSDWFLTRFGSVVNEASPPVANAGIEMDLGMAHGITGLFAAFALASSRGLVANDVSSMTMKCLKHLQGKARLSEDGGLFFPAHRDDPSPSRLAWCYGNLGAAFAFLHLAHADKSLARTGHLLVSYGLNQYREPSSQLNDACLCHGYAGAALLFHLLSLQSTLGQDTQRMCESLSRKAREDAILTVCATNDGLEFPHVHGGNKSFPKSFLEGTFGVCLALMATERPERPSWADLLLA